MAGFLANSLMLSMLVLSGPQSGKDAGEAAETVQTVPEGQMVALRGKLLGRYNLRGVMETASGLELSDDGSFRWYLVVGGLDAFSGGSWEYGDDQVTLVFDPPAEGARYDPIGTVVMQIDGENLLPPQNFGGGAYVKVQPRPENK